MPISLPRIDYPEIIIGIVAPIGTRTDTTIDALDALFRSSDYEVDRIKVTDAFKWLSRGVPPRKELVEKPLPGRLDAYIDYGNYLRERSGDNNILAALAIQTIADRRPKSSDRERKFERTAYLLHQFKRPEEIALLRSTYRGLFFQISIYSSRSNRVAYLANEFCHSKGGSNPAHFRDEAERFVSLDENEDAVASGQRVSKIFHDADYIINIDIDDGDVVHQVGRFFELLFSSNSVTPTKGEYGMYAANSAALRTSDLSRQVGAALFSPTHGILALGSNEVPKAGGGTYWSDDHHDGREFKFGSDSNDKRKEEILDDLLKKLGRSSPLNKRTRKAIENSSFMDAIEYGRIVHAEMCAITDAARNGRSLQNSTMYVTTFPCHLCAKHIVSSGVSKVVFLEPYPKSLAPLLHQDSISIEGADRGQFRKFDGVEFMHFWGVTPRQYRKMFSRGKRKDINGKFESYVGGIKRPNIDILTPFYSAAEVLVGEGLKKTLSQLHRPSRRRRSAGRRRSEPA